MKEKPRKLIPETAANRLLAGDVEMLAAAFSHGLDGTEVWPDTHLPLAVGVLWHCPERVEEMLQMLQGKGLLEREALPTPIESLVAGCWRSHPDRTQCRLKAMSWLAANGDDGTAERLVEASVGAGFALGVAEFWDLLPKSRHGRVLEMALSMDEVETLRVLRSRGVDIQDPLAQNRAIQARPDSDRGHEAARIAQMIMRASTPAPDHAGAGIPRI